MSASETEAKLGEQTKVETVRQHYARQERNESKTLYFRNFHTWVQTALLSEACKTLKGHPENNRLRVVDLACGQGGDMSKYVYLPVKDLVGIDLSEELIRRAEHRLRTAGHAGYPLYPYPEHRARFPATFYVEDLMEPLPRLTRIKTGDHPLVSMQFALHYFGESEAVLRTILSTISKLLPPGGLFVGTTVDREKLRERIRPGSSRLANDLYCLDFSPKVANSIHSPDPVPLGVGYKFTLPGRVDRVTEFVLDIRTVAPIAQSCGLEIVEWINFRPFYDKYADDYFTLFSKVVGRKTTQTTQALYAIQLYCVFIMRKADETRQ